MTDHQDGNGLNNQRYNLRPATRMQNCGNAMKRPGVTSTHKGVDFHKRSGKWRAAIGGQYIGIFREESDAATAYNFAALERYGEFAKYNMAAIA